MKEKEKNQRNCKWRTGRGAVYTGARK